MSVTVVSLFSQLLRVYMLIISLVLKIRQNCFTISCIVFQRFIHKGEKLECDMRLLFQFHANTAKYDFEEIRS